MSEAVRRSPGCLTATLRRAFANISANAPPPEAPGQKGHSSSRRPLPAIASVGRRRGAARSPRRPSLGARACGVGSERRGPTALVQELGCPRGAPWPNSQTPRRRHRAAVPPAVPTSRPTPGWSAPSRSSARGPEEARRSWSTASVGGACKETRPCVPWPRGRPVTRTAPTSSRTATRPSATGSWTNRGGAEHVSWVCEECLAGTGFSERWASDPSTGPARAEAPTRAEILAFALTLPPDEASKLLSSLRPRGRPKDTPSLGPAPPPVYRSWEDYLSKTTPAERQAWCAAKAAKANRKRLMSPAPTKRVTAAMVLGVLEAARGHCCYCGSLAVENRPSGPNGAPLQWAHVGRRVGSLGHKLARFHGGDNDVENLSWTCLWCNTWPEERRPGATDHGAVQDVHSPLG